METIKISNLQEGDLFMYKDVMYEIVHKDKWETYCKTVLYCFPEGPNDGGNWDTYEEALEAGIIKALKLI